jgi:hypothetical protein
MEAHESACRFCFSYPFVDLGVLAVASVSDSSGSTTTVLMLSIVADEDGARHTAGRDLPYENSRFSEPS